MNKLLLFLLSVASVSALAQENLSNGYMPSEYPQHIMVTRVPMGSGVPSPGMTTGYSEALPVSDGLYHVPGYLPYQSTAASLWPRVITVQCRQTEGTWYCSGYHVDGVLGRGEDVYVRPEFIQVSAPIPAASHLVVPVITPLQSPARPFVHPALRHFVKPKPKLCN